MERPAPPVMVHRRMISAASTLDGSGDHPTDSRPFDRGEPTRWSPRSTAVPHQPGSETTVSVRAITEVIAAVRTGKPLPTPATS